MDKNSKIFVAAHEKLMGEGLVRRLSEEGFQNVITTEKSQLDLISQVDVRLFFYAERPDYVILPSIRDGGILANTKYPADLGYENLQAQLNVFQSSLASGVKKLLFLGSSCMYPKHNPQPMKEEDLFMGRVEPTSETYAYAKMAGIKLCQAYNKQYNTQFISAIPPTIYGPGDDFNPETSHVISALIRRFHDAKVEKKDEVVIWGTGSPRREFLYVDDFAGACLYLMENYEASEPINIGSGHSIFISGLAHLVKNLTEFDGEIVFDKTKPDGAPYKQFDTTKLTNLGWRSTTNLEAGLEKTYNWWLRNQ